MQTRLKTISNSLSSEFKALRHDTEELVADELVEEFNNVEDTLNELAELADAMQALRNQYSTQLLDLMFSERTSDND